MRAWRIVVPAAVAVALVSGCNRSEPTETAQPAPTAVVPTSVNPDAGLWDPCALPDSALASAGLNTSTKEKDVAGVEFEGWKVCSWKNSAKTYSFTAASTTHTLDEARARTDYTDYTDLTVGPYKALRSRPVGASNDLACYISIAVPAGLVEFNVGNRVSAKQTAGDPCAEVYRLSEAFATYLPST